MYSLWIVKWIKNVAVAFLRKGKKMTSTRANAEFRNSGLLGECGPQTQFPGAVTQQLPLHQWGEDWWHAVVIKQLPNSNGKAESNSRGCSLETGLKYNMYNQSKKKFIWIKLKSAGIIMPCNWLNGVVLIQVFCFFFFFRS